MIVLLRSAGDRVRIGDIMVVEKAVHKDSVAFELNVAEDVQTEESRSTVMIWTRSRDNSNQASVNGSE